MACRELCGSDFNHFILNTTDRGFNIAVFATDKMRSKAAKIYRHIRRE
jgi:hypothetical protein